MNRKLKKQVSRSGDIQFNIFFDICVAIRHKLMNIYYNIKNHNKLLSFQFK